MRKENLPLILLMAGAGFIVVLAYFLMRPDTSTNDTKAEENLSEEIQNTPVVDQNITGGNNPDYADLTPEQVQIADIAIGKLLNSSQGITPPMITIKSFEAKEFPNAALGCPQPEMMYAEVITSGYQVVLEAQGKEYDYRLTGPENIILCEQ